MDPPDVLGLDLNAPRPTQLPGRAKSTFLSLDFQFALADAATSQSLTVSTLPFLLWLHLHVLCALFTPVAQRILPLGPLSLLCS